MKKAALCRAVAVAAAAVMAVGLVPAGSITEAFAAENSPAATLTVDLDPKSNTGDIVHGAAGFLYGVSSEGVPTTNTIVPLKSKILVTKGAVGTEHPYGDALDVAKTFLESGGQQVQMYNSNYYGVFGVTATMDRYCEDLVNYICPAVVAWKEAWNEEHGTPDNPKDAIGAVIDIDEAIVYVPINEGTPAGFDFALSWRKYCEAIRSVDPGAHIAGPNSFYYDLAFTAGQNMKTFIQYCADYNCIPDVITWHELETSCLKDMSDHMQRFKTVWEETDWTKYNEANGTEGIPEIPQVCFNEYAEMAYCGVPGRLVNWISRIEDEKVTGCLPFWHQANNLNDLAASANEGNGAWWLYKWYGDMSGVTQPVESSTEYDQLYGVSTMDESKVLSTTLFGGFTGDVTVKLENVTKTKAFRGADKVHVTVEETMFTGFHGALDYPPTIIEGTYEVASDGSVTVEVDGTLFENAYKLTISRASDDDEVGDVTYTSSGDVYEAEDAQTSLLASKTDANTSPYYYMSQTGEFARAVDMPTGAVLEYTIDIEKDGLYRLDFVYGNGQGTNRGDMTSHDPVNVIQSFSFDGEEPADEVMKSTLWQTMTGIKSIYRYLDAGEHTIEITSADGIDNGMVFHDFLRVTYISETGDSEPAFTRDFEAEESDFNMLVGNTDSTVSTETKLSGYSGSGYITGLEQRSVPEGGGVRFTVIVPESGLYDIDMIVHSAEDAADSYINLYVGNTAVTLDRIVTTVSVPASADWQTVSAIVFLEKGINVVDIDGSVDLDKMTVSEGDYSDASTTFEAEDCIPSELEDSIAVVESDGASNGEYVAGMAGSYTDPDYLEFVYNAPEAGKYALTVYHSNEDIAGTHGYNIKIIDKYAVFEVNGESDSPVFDVQPLPEDTRTVYYFVDCGDHDPTTVSEGDEFGILNTVTDQIYSEDETGYSWGVEIISDGERVESSGNSEDHAVYTTYQQTTRDNIKDGQGKETTFRYAHNQYEAGIEPRYVAYRFELDPGKYDVTMGMSNTWGNGTNPTLHFIADGIDEVTKEIEVGGQVTETTAVDLTNAETNEKGRVELLVMATTDTPSVQVTYITIKEYVEPTERELNTYTMPDGINSIDVSGDLPDDVYVGELTDGVIWITDMRSVMNDTDRYFFRNSFSDDTFDEKTILLDLKEGENTIRIYNDNSWNVTFGGTTGTPATEYLKNYTPNFDEFVITPISLSDPGKLPEYSLLNQRPEQKPDTAVVVGIAAGAVVVVAAVVVAAVLVASKKKKGAK